MISYIRGQLAAIEEEKVVVDVNGVGYGVFMPKQSIMLLPAIGSEIKIHTFLNVKEDAMQLYGFLTKDDMEVFKLVIGVSGIGPKGGLNILSQLSADGLRFAVLSDDVKAISASPGIGKKTAEKLILELKDKLSLEDAIAHSQADKVSSIAEDRRIQTDVVQALVALGYGNADALRAVKKVEITENAKVEDVLKAALKYLMI